MADYIRKIRDLLALSESDNEHEARSALLKARAIMAKHKITERDLEDPESQKVERRITDISCSPRRDPWIKSLAYVIAEHHCCRYYQRREQKKQTLLICFCGLTDDIEICMEAFRYAVDCVRSRTKKYKKKYDTAMADGYGYGFVEGLKKAYANQQAEEGWGLVLVTPEEVNQAIDGMKSFKSRAKPTLVDTKAFEKGVRDGRKFSMEKRLSDSKKEED